MASKSRRRGGKRFGVLAVLAVLALAGGIGACGRGDDLSLAIAESRSTLVAMTGSGAVAAPGELRSRKYAEVVRKLQEKIGEGADPSTVASANLLLAQAMAGQAELVAVEARGFDGALADSITRAMGGLARVREQAALAASREGYDPSAQIGELERQMTARHEEIAKFTASLQENEAAVKKLRDHAHAETDTAGEARKKERGLLAGVSGQDSRERLPAVEQAATIRREGDVHENTAAELEAQAARIEPRSEEIRREMRRAQAQKESLERAKQSLVDLKKFSEEQVRLAREGAAEAAGQLAADAGAIEKLFNESVKAKYEEAASKYASALSKANAARTGGSRQAVAVTSGTLQHAAAALQRERGESAARAARFFAEVASAPVMADAEHYKELAGSLRTEAQAAAAAAAESYASASGSMQGAGTESYTRLSEQLAKVGRGLSGAPEAGEVNPEGEAPAQEAPVNEPVEQSPGAPGGDAAPSEQPETPTESETPEAAPVDPGE